MGLFSRNKNKSVKKEFKVEECFGVTSELLDEVFNLASRYTIDEHLLSTYSKERLDVEFLNNARSELETTLLNLGKNLDDYYKGEYTIVRNTVEENKDFPYSLDALIEIYNNSLDLYLENEGVRDELNTCYSKCNKELSKLKEVLSDDKILQEFTGITPINNDKQEEEEVVEEIKETSEEEVAEKDSTLVENESINNEDEVDGDIIIDTDKARIYFIRMSRNEEDEINLNLCIENKIDKEIIVKAKDISVDGILTEPTFNCSILSGNRIYDKMTFKNDIQQLVNFEGTFYVMESDTSKVIEENKVSMFKED